MRARCSEFTDTVISRPSISIVPSDVFSHSRWTLLPGHGPRHRDGGHVAGAIHCGVVQQVVGLVAIGEGRKPIECLANTRNGAAKHGPTSYASSCETWLVRKVRHVGDSRSFGVTGRPLTIL